MSRIAVFGAGYVGLVTGACFADLGHDVVLRDVVPERIERCARGEVPIYEPGLDELLERNRERLAFTTRRRRGDRRRGVPLRRRRHAADLLRRRRPLRGLDGRRRAAAPTRSAIVVMKSTVPVGTGEKVRAALDARGLGARRLRRRIPEFLAEGTGAARLHATRTGSSSARSTRPTRDAVAALHAGHRRAGRAHRRRLRRDDQAGLERLPLDADQLHQRDRERLRARRRRRRRRSREGVGPRPPARAATSCAPASASAARASRRTSPR